MSDMSSNTVKCQHTAIQNPPEARTNAYEECRSNISFQDELVLKIRVANTEDLDFVEVELPRCELTYQALLGLCCNELELNPHQVQRLRKLPNTILRKDKDIQRLRDFQEIEVVVDSTSVRSVQNANGIASSLPVLPANGYQSISKKDQTILY